jgi:hypothetical protein
MILPVKFLWENKLSGLQPMQNEIIKGRKRLSKTNENTANANLKKSIINIVDRYSFLNKSSTSLPQLYVKIKSKKGDIIR